MTLQNTTPTRRSFIMSALAATAAIPALIQITKSSAYAADPAAKAAAVPTGTATAEPTVAEGKGDGKPLDPTGPLAKQLGYAHSAASVDKAAFPRKQDGQNCKNCVLFQKGGLKADGQSGEWGKCGLFPAGLVSASGWRNPYAMKVTG